VRSLAANGGTIINIGSAAVTSAPPTYSRYVATKSGVNGIIVPKFRISMAFTDALSPYAGDKNAAMKHITGGAATGYLRRAGQIITSR
jgi:NAD(P)-dependent dehydrogenase (short-subunit alcohol dehydrogenase family)